MAQATELPSGLVQTGEARQSVGVWGVSQCGGLMTNTLSPSITGNRHRPSASVLVTSRPVRDQDTRKTRIALPTLPLPLRASNTEPLAISARGAKPGPAVSARAEAPAPAITSRRDGVR